MPLIIVIAYFYNQARFSGDYKEMMTAIAAVLVSIYHLARTVWGLVQLYWFRKWCARSMHCVTIVSGFLKNMT